MHVREPGVFWVSINECAPEIAEWDGRSWWTIGSETPCEPNDVRVLSDRILAPELY